MKMNRTIAAGLAVQPPMQSRAERGLSYASRAGLDVPIVPNQVGRSRTMMNRRQFFCSAAATATMLAAAPNAYSRRASN